MLDWWDSRFLVNSQIRGVFIGDINYPDLDNHIFVLYEFTGLRWFTAFEQTMQDSDYFVTVYDVDKRHVMFVYDVSPKYQQSYKMFRESKYSKLDEQLKQKIIYFHGEDKTKKIAAIMYRHESVYQEWEAKINEGLPYKQHTKIPRDQEATDVLHMEVEVYNSAIGPKPGPILASNKEFFKEKEKIEDEGEEE